MVLTLDLETSIYNTGNPFDTRNFIVSAHTKVNDDITKCNFHDAPDFKTNLRQSLERATLFVGVNCKFDLHWLRNEGLRLANGCRVWDCMVAEYVLSGQTSTFPGLNELAKRYDLGQKADSVAEYWAKGISTEFVPRDLVRDYGNVDVDLTHSVYHKQLADARMTDQLHRLILLMGLDLLVLQDMEWNGFLYDSAGSLARADTLTIEIDQIKNELNQLSDTPINFASGDQLSCFLYGGVFTEDVYKPVDKVYQSGPKKGECYIRNEYQGTIEHKLPGFFKPLRGTALKKEGMFSTAEDTLLQLKATTKEQRRIVYLLNRMGALDKLVGTYLSALPNRIEEMHWKDNYVHGNFNQVVARTGRLSSSAPNMQNAPEEVDEFFISRY